ncbi:hypothetical protein [Dermatophilus congolensis]|uniref:DoxX n=1 Tax=Dermatophilus congolensis TaxID=1863 RepID=A0AA46BLL9_9MICO|nr:hypothetical protein [Dermatophilus congolensis]MBO3142080.1 hypothetical protein [Dermatophilus congolensis]MBO3151071.1 hypothetical protein [Dermatophilus congolensis]MBO3161924.1 hypothetical protein [Dermatophilus congolensis]MBO3162358.1 hypothetical protein [Dermatophilus congolensis]MBO3175912.1 hypothetical protein [Dermatophilus congolensis]
MSLVLAPARLAAGLFILNSGLGKRNLPTDAYENLRDMGANGVPQLKDVPADTFGKALSYGETALGAALILPVVPNWAAGLALGAFSGGLLNMYRNTPGLTVDGIRPTQEGTAIAKDVFLTGIAGSLLLDSLFSAGRGVKKSAKKAQKHAAKKARKAKKELIS